MGRRSVLRGKAFERKLCRIFREKWPDAIVRRASQADRAFQSDVYVTGGHPMLARLWFECQDSRKPTPLVKLQQAERDAKYDLTASRLPVCIWHELGARDIHATMRAWVFDAVRSNRGPVCDAVVTVRLEEFLGVIGERS